jgi:hypothetical protein
VAIHARAEEATRALPQGACVGKIENVWFITNLLGVPPFDAAKPDFFTSIAATDPRC